MSNTSSKAHRDSGISLTDTKENEEVVANGHITKSDENEEIGIVTELPKMDIGTDPKLKRNLSEGSYQKENKLQQKRKKNYKENTGK